MPVPYADRDNRASQTSPLLLLAVVLVGLCFSSERYAPTVHAQTRRWVTADVDGDGRSDLVVWRPTDGVWYALESKTDYTTTTIVPFGSGAQGDIPLMGDLDGDGKRDFVMWRPSVNPGGTYIWLLSSTNYTAGGSEPFGVAARSPALAIGDMDGDGLDDPAKLEVEPTVSPARVLAWLTSRSHYQSWSTFPSTTGVTSDQPMLGDFGGDGRTDLALFRPSTGEWFWYYTGSDKNHGGFLDADTRRFGGPGDQPLVGDFDGDGRADIVIWRPSTGEWFWLTSSSGWSTGLIRTFGSGSVGDIPQLGDFDGDGRSDLTIWRPSTGEWFWLTSSSGWSTGRSITFGTGTLGDIPMLK